MLINYENSSGCDSCAVVCKQEHNHPEGKWWINVEENVFLLEKTAP